MGDKSRDRRAPRRAVVFGRNDREPAGAPVRKPEGRELKGTLYQAVGKSVRKRRGEAPPGTKITVTLRRAAPKTTVGINAPLQSGRVKRTSIRIQGDD